MEYLIIPLAVLFLLSLYELKKEHANSKELEQKFLDISSKFEKLQHQKISADVKLGQKTENLLPFLDDFPYKDSDIRGLFNPIDLIVFDKDAIIFVEVKSGQSQLSEKQRHIRDLIKAGKVRFEIHRVNEHGISVK